MREKEGERRREIFSERYPEKRSGWRLAPGHSPEFSSLITKANTQTPVGTDAQRVSSVLEQL